MKTIETQVYQFDELDDRAKERARDWYRLASAGDFDDFNAETVIEDAARLFALIGVDIRQTTVPTHGGGTRTRPTVYYSGFCHQGQGASFEANYAYKAGGTAALRAEAPPIWEDKPQESNVQINQIADELQELQRRHFYRLTASVRRDAYSRGAHEMTTTVDVYDGENEADEATAEAVTEAMRDLMRWLYRQLETEYDYQQSDAAVDESIRANEYEFCENGKRACSC